MKKTMLMGLLLAGLPAYAADPPSLADVNPLGHRMLSAPDYPHYHPAPGPLTGRFVPAYSGTSELFLQGVLNRLAQFHPGVAWTRERRFDCSTGILAGMLDGSAELGISSVPMTSAQREEFTRRFGYPVLEARIALDALQILVHPDNPLDGLTVPQLDAIYGTELRAGALQPIRTWEEAGAGAWGAGRPIHAVAGALHYGTSGFFRDAVLMGGPWREDIRSIGWVEHPEEALAADPQAIAFSNHRPRDGRVKVLAIARQTDEPCYPPLPSRIYGEDYPLVRFFFVYANAPDIEDLPPVIREFLNFLLSFEGQAEIARTGSLPLDRILLLRSRARLGL